MKLKAKDSIVLTIIWTLKFKLPAFLTKGNLNYTDSLNKNYQYEAIAKAFKKAFITQYFS